MRLFACACVWGYAQSTLTAHPLFADHAVLQTTDDGGPGAHLSGTGEAGETVQLTSSPALPTAVSAATVQSDGSWMMDLNVTSGGPYTITLTGSKSKQTVQKADILFGDVIIL